LLVAAAAAYVALTSRWHRSKEHTHDQENGTHRRRAARVQPRPGTGTSRRVAGGPAWHHGGGQLLAHIADANYQICSAASGDTNPNTGSIEQTKTTKADIQAALASAFAYCRAVYDNTTDAQGAEMVPFFGGQEMARSAILAFNSGHTYEHYGNLVTYMRLNDITPPTSQP
jgi:hypothetical protein